MIGSRLALSLAVAVLALSAGAAPGAAQSTTDHEVGHWMGLYHTIKKSPAQTRKFAAPLDDLPAPPTAHDPRQRDRAFGSRRQPNSGRDDGWCIGPKVSKRTTAPRGFKSSK